MSKTIVKLYWLNLLVSPFTTMYLKVSLCLKIQDYVHSLFNNFHFSGEICGSMLPDGFLKIFAANSFFFFNLLIGFKIGPSIWKLSCEEQTWHAFYKGIYLSDLLLFFPSFHAIFTQLLQLSCQNNQLP